LKRRTIDAGREYVELSREVWSLHKVKAMFRKQDRVQHQIERRDQFVERALEDSYR
jgi:hypothetical protein